jgi:glycosyltransferase involved in cell wall biosynthesis
MQKVLFIDTVDFESFHPGGTLNFARQMLAAFGDRLCLVGVVTDDTPLGKWTKREINGVSYSYFPYARRQLRTKKPLIPSRLVAYWNLRRYQKEIMSLGIRSAFMQTHEVVMATGSWGWDHLCFRFPGVENPLSISRYKGAGLLAQWFDRAFFPTVSRADVILAAADKESILGMVNRSKGKITADQVVSFPTRVDTAVFRPMQEVECRKAVGLPGDAVVLATCGRIHWAKGWKFLIDVLRSYLKSCPNAYLCFIGDGEERINLEKYAAEKGVADRVRVTGFQSPREVAVYLNAADMYVTGSYVEGWATVMLEALACGLPIISTKVSSASEIVTDGRNGYVMVDRDVELFVEAIGKAFALGNVTEFSLETSEKYAVKNLARDMGKLFSSLIV